MVERPCRVLLVSDQSWMADVLLGACETRLLMQRGIMQRTGCALAGPPLLARATLTLPLKSAPAALFTYLVLLLLLVSPELHAKLCPPLRNQKLSWQVFVRSEKCWQGPFFDTQEHKGRLQHPCTFMSGLSSPGSSWFFTSSSSLLMFEWHRGQFSTSSWSFLIWESWPPPRPLVAIWDTRLSDDCQECEC